MQQDVVTVPGGGHLEVDRAVPSAADPTAGRVWRVGYAPEPWAWTPWEYAQDGRFPGRWDDPDGRFRTVYLSDTLVTSLLEVLSKFRPDPLILEEDIEVAVEDQELYPTPAPGAVPLDWVDERLAASAELTGTYAAVTRAGSLSTLRSRFLQLASTLGLPDIDAGVLKLAEPRPLTQAIAGWLHGLHDQGRHLVDGVRFDSRHGDGQPVWAVFERPGDGQVSDRLTDQRTGAMHPDDPHLVEAFRLHGLHWVPR